MKSVVLICRPLNSRASISTCCLKSGSILTSAIRRLTLATVSFTCGIESFCFIALNPSMLKSRGKARLTCSTDISIPVFSEAYDVTCFTIQFWTGGIYISIASVTNSSIGTRITMPIHLNIFFIMAYVYKLIFIYRSSDIEVCKVNNYFGKNEKF